MNKPKYSILIPTYNRASLIAETLDCAFSQDYPNLEIIVCDNCSTDDTWKVLCAYKESCPQLIIYQNKTNVGPVLNWVKCLELATGEFGKLLYSDDLISSNFVSETMRHFDSETSFVLSRHAVFKHSNELPSANVLPDVISSKSYLRDIILYGQIGYTVTPTTASFRICDLKKNLIADIPNPLDLDYKKHGAGNDLLLLLITALDYKNVKACNLAVAYLRDHPTSITKSNSLNAFYHFTREYFIITYFRELLPEWLTLSRIRQIRGHLPFLPPDRKYKFKSFKFIFYFGWSSLHRKLKSTF